MTEGQFMRTLDLDGQREYLARKDIRAWKVGPKVTATVDGLECSKGGQSTIAAWAAGAWQD
jgi:hypothetical protein